MPETDILIISLPGTPDTYHMIAEEQLALLPDHAVIINVGRGSVIDQKALLNELKKGRLYGTQQIQIIFGSMFAQRDPYFTGRWWTENCWKQRIKGGQHESLEVY